MLSSHSWVHLSRSHIILKKVQEKLNLTLVLIQICPSRSSENVHFLLTVDRCGDQQVGEDGNLNPYVAQSKRCNNPIAAASLFCAGFH